MASSEQQKLNSMHSYPYSSSSTNQNSNLSSFSPTTKTTESSQNGKSYTSGMYQKSIPSRTSTFSTSNYSSRSQQPTTYVSNNRGQSTIGRKSNVIRIDARNPTKYQTDSSNYYSNTFAKVSSIKSPTPKVNEEVISPDYSSTQYLIEPQVASDLPPPPLPMPAMTTDSTVRRPNSSSQYELPTKSNAIRGHFPNSTSPTTTTHPWTATNNYATMDVRMPPTYSVEATLPYNHSTSVKTTLAGEMKQDSKLTSSPTKSPTKTNFELSELSYTNLKSEVDSTIKSEQSKTENKNCKKFSSKNSWFIIIFLFVLLLICIGLLLFVTFGRKQACGKDTDVKIVQCTKDLPKRTPLPDPRKRKTCKQTISKPSGRSSANDNVCMTTGCTQTAGDILRKMNRSVDPCTDFYEFSCGGWIDNNYIPPQRSSYGVVSKISETNELLLHEVLTRPIDPRLFNRDVNGKNGIDGITEAETKAKLFYQSCVSMEQINSLGPRPMLDLIDDMGGWDALGTWREATWDFNELLYRIQGLQSASVFFSMSIQLDKENASKNVLRIDQDGITLPDRSFYLIKATRRSYGRPMVVPAYKRLIKDILVLLGATQNVDQVVDEIFLFEKKLAEIIVSDHEKLQSGDDMVTIKDITEISPQIDWFRLFKRIIRKSSVNHKTRISVASKYFLRRLSALIRNSPRRILHNYMIWRSTVTKALYLSTPFRRAIEQFSASLFGFKEPLPLWQDCLRQVNQNFEMATGALFVRETFSPQNKREINGIASDVKKAFERNLENVTWMDAKTKEAAIEKLNAMTVKIGYEDDLLNPAKLNALYTFPVHECCYFHNVLKSIEQKIVQSVEKIFVALGSDERRLSPQTVNAYYSPIKNQMVFPAGLLQRPLYNEGAPMSLNYGAVGSIIGHEMTHGYDNSGAAYDKFGSINPWWSDVARQRYKERTNCVVDAYKDFSIGNLYVQGISTLDENIADIAGLKLAYMAYMQRPVKETVTLPGTGLTNQQLLFVGFAQTWCMKRKMHSYQMQLQQDHHAPEQFRVIGSVMQLEEFSKVFKCPVNSPMNPKTRCKVW